MTTYLIAKFPGLRRVSTPDIIAVCHVAERLGCHPNDLFAAMQFESGIDTTAVNKASGATGLIQFMRSTAAALGTTTSELARLSFADQLPYVERYLGWFKPLRDIEQVYLAIFYPKARGMAPADIVALAGSSVYRQNQVFDHDHDGKIQRQEITAAVRGVLNDALLKGTFPVDTGDTVWSAEALTDAERAAILAGIDPSEAITSNDLHRSLAEADTDPSELTPPGKPA